MIGVRHTLAFKAEMILGWQLASRHRAPRLALGLGLVLLVLLLLRGDDPAEVPRQQRALLLSAGVLGATAGSRLLARGAALACAQRACGRWWLVAGGRLAGVLILVTAASAVGCAALGAQGYHTAAVVVVATAALTAVVMGLAPLVGASAAAFLGLSVLVVPLSPLSATVVLEPWPLAQRVTVLALHVLPVPWRALQLLSSPAPIDWLVLLGWTLAGVSLAGWAATRPAAA